MALPAAKLFGRISDFYNKIPPKERDALAAVWQSVFERVGDLRQTGRAIDLAKGVFSVPVTVRSLKVPLIFDDDSKLTESRPGFPFGHSTQADVVGIPTLDVGFADKEDVPAAVLTDTADYIIEDGKIFFAVTPPGFLVAPTLERNMELIRNNFGFLIDFFRTNSENYRKRTQGIWAALFGGSTLQNLQLGMSAVIDVPITSGGTVTAIETQVDGSQDITIGGETISVPKILVPKVNVTKSQVLPGFQAITDAVMVTDFKADPDFPARFGIKPILKFFTFAVTVEAGVVVDLIGPLGSLQDLFSGGIDFIEKAKPHYTDFVLSVFKEFDEEILEISTESEPRVIELDLPSTVDTNPVNIHYGIDGMDIDLGSLDEDAYVAQGGDDRLDLDSDSLYWHDRLEIEDIPTSGDPEIFPAQGQEIP